MCVSVCLCVGMSVCISVEGEVKDVYLFSFPGQYYSGYKFTVRKEREKSSYPVICEKGIDNKEISNLSLIHDLCVIGQKMLNWN